MTMLSFRQYRQTKPQATKQVTETTVPNHLSHIPEDLSENYYHTHVSEKTHEKMHSALGGKGFTTFPLNDDDHSANDDVVEHLANHGYSVKDYRKGIAHKLTTVGDPERGIPHRQKMVEEKIGSVLERTQAPDHVKKAYMNDGSRTGFKAPRSDSLHVLVSTTPHAIAGMSTGTPWHSCVNLVNGGNKQYIKTDMEHGTHVAYLVRHDDPTAFKTGAPTHPLARIALKPFHHENDHDDVIYRSDSKDYGHGGDKFRNSVDEWSHKHYPADVGVTYNRNENTLNNAGDLDTFTHVNHNDAIQNLEDGYGVDGGAHSTNKTYMTHDTTSKVLSHFTKKLKETDEGLPEIRRLIQSVSFSPAHVKHVLGLIDQGHKLITPLSEHHGNMFPASAIEKHFGNYKEESATLPEKIIKSPNLPDHIVDGLNHWQLMNVSPGKIKQKHIDKIVNDYSTHGMSPDPHTLGRFSQHFSSDNIGRIVTKPNYVPGVVDHPKFTKEHHDNWLSNASDMTKSSIISDSPHASMNDVGDESSLYDRLLRNSKISKTAQHEIKNHIIDKVKSQSTDLGSDDNKWESRFNLYKGDGYTAHRSQSFIPNSVSQHFKREDYDVIAQAGKVPKFETPEHSARLLDSYRSLATTHDNKLSQHIDDRREESGLDHDDFYHEDNDHEAQGLRKTLHRHMARYGAALEDHYNEHAIDVKNGTGGLTNLKEHENVGQHIGSLGHMGAYYSPHNSHLHGNDRDVTEHYFEHFGDVEDSHITGEHQRDYDTSIHW